MQSQSYEKLENTKNVQYTTTWNICEKYKSICLGDALIIAETPLTMEIPGSDLRGNEVSRVLRCQQVNAQLPNKMSCRRLSISSPKYVELNLERV